MLVGCNAATMGALLQGMQEMITAKLNLESELNNNDIATNAIDQANCEVDDVTTAVALDVDDEYLSDYDGADSGIDKTSTRAISPGQFPTDETTNSGENSKKPNNVRPQFFDLITFTSEDEYSAYMKRENWTVKYTDRLQKVVTRYMRCCLVKSGKEECAARIVVRMPKDELKWIVQSNRLAHTHELINNKPLPELRKKVTIMRRQRIPPSKAHGLLQEELGEDAPAINQIYHLFRVADNAERRKFTNLGQLVDWFTDNSNQTSDDEPFVLNYRTSNIEDARTDFQYVFSTPRLLKTALEFRIISCDATYKVNEHDYPLILVGGIDANQKFHLLAFSVTTREETSNYKFLFETLRDCIKQQHQKDFNPEILVADGAGAIAKGFKEAFVDNEVTIVMCYFHVLKNVKKMMGSKHHVALVDRGKIIKDIDDIHDSFSKEVFERSIHLFVEKWKHEYEDFCSYFADTWLIKHPGWYNGFLHKCPSTNNGVEGFNSNLKRNHTYRELMPLGAFNVEMFRILKSKSLKYETRDIPKQITIDTFLWIAAINWEEVLDRSITVRKSLTKTTYYVPSTKSMNNDIFPTSKSIKTYNKMKADDFDQFITLMSSMWKIEFDSAYWELSICSCPQWISRGICKHVIGIGISLKILHPPANANPQKLRVRTKKMLPQAAVTALNRQPNFVHSDQQSIQPSTSQSSIPPNQELLSSPINPSIQSTTSRQLNSPDDNQSQPIQSSKLVTRGRKKATTSKLVLRRSKSNVECAVPVPLMKGHRVGAGRSRRSKSSITTKNPTNGV